MSTDQEKPGYMDFVRNKLHVRYFPKIMDEEEVNYMKRELESKCHWACRGTALNVNSPIDFPPNARSTAFYGERGVVGAYDRAVRDWSDGPIVLLQLKAYVESLTGRPSNYAVVQRYPRGGIGINPHHDREIVPGTIIAGVSLGGLRDLTMRRFQSIITIPLRSGSLYVLYDPTNDYWSHCIEKDDTETQPRISITYRFHPISNSPLLNIPMRAIVRVTSFLDLHDMCRFRRVHGKFGKIDL